MQEGKLTLPWTRASAGLPLGWILAGVVHREVAARWRLGEDWADDDWIALAIERDGPGSVRGGGSSPEQALAYLAEALRRMRGDPNG